jgi:hypothetical protein
MFMVIPSFQVLVTASNDAPGGRRFPMRSATSCRNAVRCGLLDQLGQVA